MLAALAGGSAGTAMAQSPGVGLIRGEAYGSRALLKHSSLPTVTLGRTAWQTLPCVVFNDTSANNHVNQSHVVGGIDTPVLVDTGTVDNNGVVDISGTVTDVLESSTIQNVDLLGGLITATAIKAQAHVTHDAANDSTNLHTGPGDPVPTGATFVNLVIAGTPIGGSPPPNTSIDLPGGIGRVILNSVASEENGRQVRNIAMHVKLTNLAGYSGEIVVALARAGVAESVAALQAEAYELKATLGKITSIGKQNYVRLQCFRAGQTERHNFDTAAGVNGGALPITSGTLNSTVDGFLLPTPSTRAIAEIQSVDVAGQLTASMIHMQANAFQTPFGVGANANGTEFVNLVVGGQAFGGSPPPNTVIQIPGLGSVELNRQVCTADETSPGVLVSYRPTDTRPCQGFSIAKIVVTGAVMKVLETNPTGLPLGLEIRVAEALASIRTGLAPAP